MKKVLLLFVLCFNGLPFCMVSNANLYLDFKMYTNGNTEKELELEGKAIFKAGRRAGRVLRVFLQENLIRVDFDRNIREVTITIKNQLNQTVYSTNVDSNLKHFTIPLGGLPDGAYTITFSNDRGKMWGNFEIN